MTNGALFAGIGGMELGLERAGFDLSWLCELHPYRRRVLARRWPGVPLYHDAAQLPPDTPRVDLLSGGFPCQPMSQAGVKLGERDERWLWPAFIQAVRLLRPRYVLVENVTGLLARGFSRVLGDLAESGYDAEWDCIPAAALGAPHLRERVFLVAYTHQEHQQGRGSVSEGATARPPAGALPDADETRHQGVGSGQGWRRLFEAGGAPPWGEWPPEPGVDRVAHGVSRGLDRLEALGDSVVPAVAEWVGKRIMDFEEGRWR